MPRTAYGFSLVELVTVMVIIGVLAAISSRISTPNKTNQLQASRDTILAAFASAQQRAMVQTDSVRLIADANAIDIRQDSDNNGVFSASESAFIGGSQYPISLLPNQTLSTATFDFDRLGQTTAQALTLSQDGSSVAISISSTGYAY